MKNIHPEFEFQSRELGYQIEDTLGDPPNRKNYDQVIKSLLTEFAAGSAIDDLNLLSFALVDFLNFDDAAGLLAQSADFDQGDAALVRQMVSSSHAGASKVLDVMLANNPELLRKAIITAFLFKNGKRWVAEDHSLEALQKEEDGDDEEDEDSFSEGHEIEHLFDVRGDENG